MSCRSLLGGSQAECRTLEATLREAADRMRHLTRDRDASRQMQREMEQHLAEVQEQSNGHRA